MYRLPFRALKFSAFAALSFLCANDASAWDKGGHRDVCLTAWAQMASGLQATLNGPSYGRDVANPRGGVRVCDTREAVLLSCRIFGPWPFITLRPHHIGGAFCFEASTIPAPLISMPAPIQNF